MKKLIQKISAVLQVVLLAPVKLPGKALNIVKYIALGLGMVETVLEDKDKKGEVVDPPDQIRDQEVHLLDHELNNDSDRKGVDGYVDNPSQLMGKMNSEREVPDET